MRKGSHVPGMLAVTSRGVVKLSDLKDAPLSEVPTLPPPPIMESRRETGVKNTPRSPRSASPSPRSISPPIAKGSGTGGGAKSPRSVTAATAGGSAGNRRRLPRRPPVPLARGAWPQEDSPRSTSPPPRRLAADSDYTGQDYGQPSNHTASRTLVGKALPSYPRAAELFARTGTPSLATPIQDNASVASGCGCGPLLQAWQFPTTPAAVTPQTLPSYFAPCCGGGGPGSVQQVMFVPSNTAGATSATAQTRPISPTQSPRSVQYVSGGSMMGQAVMPQTISVLMPNSMNQSRLIRSS
eukprot:TRINITY_DN17976_c0_g1_i1.p1 TRINITY_DN17976_c0_g1~~TRINITY_DN17976_c0_g1_i1.p1  ORF type:complete len:297 (-),score=39.86 TRINITY_DN17976_c0_g1_i1:80-970(-)